MYLVGRRGTLVAGLLISLFTLGPARTLAAAVTDYLGRQVIQVQLELEGTELREPAILDVITTVPGQPLSMSQVRESISHLFGFGRYEDVQVRASQMPGGVSLVYDLIPIHRVRDFQFRGMLAIGAGELRSAVRDRLGPAPAVARASDAIRVLEDLYRDRGYRHPTIRSRSIMQPDPDATTLIFEIDAGSRTRVGKIAVEGAPVAAEALLNRLDVRTGQPFESVRLVAALDRYRAELQSRRYYEARANYLPRYSDDDLTVDLTILIDPGPLVAVRFEGDSLTERELGQLVPIAREQSVDEDLLEDSKLRIENRLKSQGYRDARADYRRVEDNGMLTVTFSISRGPQYRLGLVDFSGNTALPTSQLRTVFRLKEDAPFVDAILAADVAGMADMYRRQGFADVKIDSVGLPPDRTGDERIVAVRIAVSEGVRTSIREVTFTGNTALPESTLRKVAGLNPGQPFYDPQTMTATEALQIEYLNRGYQNASVERTITWSSDRRQIDVSFRLQEGGQVLVDHILIVGNTRTTSDTIERELVLKPGDPVGQEAIVQSQQRLAGLGLFRRIDISQLRHPGEENLRDVLVTVQEAPSTTLGWGGGFEGGKRLRLSEDGTGVAEERIEFTPHGFFDVGRRNLWGKNRSIDLFARVSFRARGESAVTTPTSATNARYGFNEYRVLLNYREPKVLDTSADGLATAYIEQGIRSSFNFVRRGTRLELARRVSSTTSVSGRYSLDHTRLLDERLKPDERPIIDRVFPQVRLSAFSSSVIRNTRDDPLDPTRGTLLTLDGSLAARNLGSEVGFIKTLVKGSLYHRLADSSRVVFAGASTVGLAHGFPRPVPGGGQSDLVEDLPASERFYAGGDTSVRGFALDRLGRPDTFDNAGFPRGGHALVIFNAELRTPVWRALETVGFLDVGNVFAKINDLNLTQLRGGTGFGLRYRSPVGPIRVDLGFKLSRLDFQGQKEPLTALHISLGQAF